MAEWLQWPWGALAEQTVLDVIGTDAAGLAALAPRSLVLLRDAELLMAPARLLGQLEPWWRTEQAEGRIPAELPCHERLASDRPEEIYGPLVLADFLRGNKMLLRRSFLRKWNRKSAGAHSLPTR